MKDQDMLIRGLLDEGRAAIEWAGPPSAPRHEHDQDQED